MSLGGTRASFRDSLTSLPFSRHHPRKLSRVAHRQGSIHSTIVLRVPLLQQNRIRKTAVENPELRVKILRVV